MIKKFIVILFCIPVLFMMGCTEKASTEDRMAAEKYNDLSEQIEKMNEQLVQYESDLAESEKTIKKSKNRLNLPSIHNVKCITNSIIRLI